MVSKDETSSLNPIDRLSDPRSERAKKWNLLDSITVSRFKAVKQATIPLDRVTILVGPNGCGKSSILQAIHWAARSASYISLKNQTEMISFERLDYVPSSEPLTTLHKGELSSHKRDDPIEVIFSHRSENEEASQVKVKINAARNRGGISTHIEGGSAVTPYKQRYQFITAYIPGLAGLSEKESILAQPALRRQAASGDAGGVLRNIILSLCTRRLNENTNEEADARLKSLNELVGRIHKGVSVKVSFNNQEDYHISAGIYTENLVSARSLETAATGLLQVIQIFAYLILFEPKVMLIDEPDAHLHPDKQEILIDTLEWAAQQYDTQIILTTHSPHIVRAASPSAKIVWMQDGMVKTQDESSIRRRLGWGGLDKPILFFIEDEDDAPIRAILRQWPQLLRQMSICRCFGVDNLPKDKFLKGLLVDGELKNKVIIHRDRDFMMDEEVAKWVEKYKTNDVISWVTEGADVEAYFCQADYLSSLFGVPVEIAERWQSDALKNIKDAKKDFWEKRENVNRIFYSLKDGGSPSTEKLWKEANEVQISTVKGKKLLASIKEVIKKDGRNISDLNHWRIPDGFMVAPELKLLIEKSIFKK